MDMSSIQKVAGKKLTVDGVSRVQIQGGVIHKSGCHCCSVDPKLVSIPKIGDQRCDRCINTGHVWCFCEDMLTKDVVAHLREQLDGLYDDFVSDT